MVDYAYVHIWDTFVGVVHWTNQQVANFQFDKKFLNKNNIPVLYKTPKLFPEYNKDYYAVYFEDPDRIKLEVAYYP